MKLDSRKGGTGADVQMMHMAKNNKIKVQMNSPGLPSHLKWTQRHFNKVFHKVWTHSLMHFCQIMFQGKFMTVAFQSESSFLSPTKQSKVSMTKKAKPFSTIERIVMDIQVPESCLWSQEEKKKKKEVLSRKGEKKLSTLTFPPFSSLFVSLWTCSPWMRHKGSWGERLQNHCDCHTQILSLEPAVGATNPMPTLP